MEATFLIAEEIDAIEAPFLHHALHLVCRRQKRKHKMTSTRLHEVLSVSDFKNSFCLSPGQVEELIGDLHPFYKNRRGTKWPIRKTVLACMWALATQESYRAVAERFCTSKSLICTHLHEFCSLVSEHLAHRVRWPRSDADVQEAERGFQRAGFPHTLCAVGHCAIPIPQPQGVGDADAYLDVGGQSFSVSLTGFCDASSRFVHAETGLPGSWPPAVLFNRTTVAQGLQVNPLSFLPEGMHMIGGAAHPLSRHLLTPYPACSDLTPQQQRYNERLSAARTAIHKAFLLLKERFKRLQYIHMQDIHNISTTVEACCVLHNVCLEGESDSPSKLDVGEVAEGSLAEAPHDPAGVQKRDHICTSFGQGVCHYTP